MKIVGFFRVSSDMRIVSEPTVPSHLAVVDGYFYKRAQSETYTEGTAWHDGVWYWVEMEVDENQHWTNFVLR